MSKKVLISGSYGTGNVGDEVILERLLEQFVGHEITVLSQGSSYTEEFFKGVSVLEQTPSWRPIRILKDLVKCRFSQLRARFNFLKAVRSADIFVVGGGGLFAELVPQVLEFYLHQIKWANFFGTKTIVMGVGVGPLRTESGKKNLAKTFNRCVSGALVRDDQSYENLKSVGVTTKVQVCPDFAFLGEISAPCKIDEVQKKRVVVNLYRVFSDASIWANADFRHESFIKTIKKTIQSLLDSNYKVELLPFGTIGDLKFCNEIVQEFSGDISVYSGQDYRSIQQRFTGAYFSITMRFHAGLLSFLHGTPSLCIDQQYKSERLLIDMKLEKLLLSLPDGFHKEGSSDLKIKDVLDSIDALVLDRDAILDTATTYFAAKKGLARTLLNDFLLEHGLIEEEK